MLDALAAEPANSAIARAKKASLLYAAGKTRREAYATVDEALKKQPQSETALLVKANLLYADRRYDDALAAALAAQAAAPSSPGPAFALGRVQAARNEWSEATQALLTALRIAPGLIPAQLELARTYLLAGHPDEALRTAENTLASQRGNVQAILIKSRALIATGNTVGAFEKTLEVLLPQHHGDPHRSRRSSVCSTCWKRDPVSARRAFEVTALKKEPDNVAALLAITRLDFAEGHGTTAQTRLKNALAANPNSSGLAGSGGSIQDVALGKSDDAGAAAEAGHRGRSAEPSRPTRCWGIVDMRQQRRIDDAIVQLDKLAARKTTVVVGQHR